MVNTTARAPASPSAPVSSSAEQRNPSGSFAPVCVWASNRESLGTLSLRASSHGSRASSSYTPARAYCPGSTGLEKGGRLMSGDRLTALDATFLQIEDRSAHMHVASVLTFAGDPPGYNELVQAVEERLHLVPRYRQRVVRPPLGAGLPRWVDDPHFNMRYHVRHSALPVPGG